MADKEKEIGTEDVKGEEQAGADEMLEDLEPQGDVKGGGMYWDDSGAGS